VGADHGRERPGGLFEDRRHGAGKGLAGCGVGSGKVEGIKWKYGVGRGNGERWDFLAGHRMHRGNLEVRS